MSSKSVMIYPTTIPPAPILGDLATPVYTPALPSNHIFEKSVSFSGLVQVWEPGSQSCHH